MGRSRRRRDDRWSESIAVGSEGFVEQVKNETVFGFFGRYCEESGLELKQAASISKSKPEHL